MAKSRNLTLLLSFILLLGLVSFFLTLRYGQSPHFSEEMPTKTHLNDKISEAPVFPPELKEMALTLIPTEEEVQIEIKRFKEARGYEPEAIVIGMPPAIFNRDQVRQILAKVEVLLEKGYQIEVIWNIPKYTCLCYADMLAEEIEMHSIPTKVYSIIREEEAETLEIINTFKSRNISIWIKSAEGRSKFVKVPPSLDEEKLSIILNATQALYSGENLSIVVTEGCGEGNWVRDKIYHGWICVFNHCFNHKWWFWRDCSLGILSGCRDEGPSELTACDIHYMREMYFYGDMGRTNGLINFPGCKPAENPEKCKGSCGVINTLWMSNCNLTFSKLPLNEEIYFIYACYIPTHTSKDPFPYLSYCGCFGRCPDPQIFIIDIKYVFTP